MIPQNFHGTRIFQDLLVREGLRRLVKLAGRDRPNR